MAIWRTVLEQTYSTPGGPGYSTFHYRHDGIDADLAADLNTAQGALLTALSQMVPFLPTTTTWRTSGVWQEVQGTREVTTGRATATGTSASTLLLPGNVCFVLGWRTEDRTRSGRGRSFLSGLASNATDNGTPTSAALTAAAAAITSLVNFNAGPANGSWGIYSEQDAVIRDITGGRMRDVFGSLRSRRE